LFYFTFFFSPPLSAKGEERGDKRSDVGVSNRRQAKLRPKDSHHFKKNNLALTLCFAYDQQA
jgi:hypothetical protein